MEAVVARGCLGICACIADLLVAAKHNKDECQSLRALVMCIECFLKKIPSKSVSESGSTTLRALQDVLSRAEGFVRRITNTGPLMSILTASMIRDEFLLINRDLTSTFQILASGEQLLELASARSDVPKVVEQLKYSKTFFAKQEQLEHRLKETAAVAQQQHSPDELLHSALLRQLNNVEEVVSLSPDELLSELRALQLAAMYDNTNLGKKKTLGSHTEEFLIQQLCAALSPKAALASEPLTSPDAPKVPNAYLCPISREIMVNPVMLAETGQTYEAANIQRWLASHNTCPATNRQVKSKAVSPNYSLKALIHEWAEQHGVALPIVQEHTTLLVQHETTSLAKDVAAMAAAIPSSTHPQTATLEDPVVLAGQNPGGRKITGSWARCTRTKWFIVLLVAVIGLSVGVGLGVHFWNKGRANKAGGPAIVCKEAPAPVANATWATDAGGPCAGAKASSTCTATCNPSSSGGGTFTATCKEDGTWTTVGGSCDSVAKAKLELAPALNWTDSSFNYQFYTSARTWQQAEEFCMQIGKDYHLASINTEQEFIRLSNKMLAADPAIFSYGEWVLAGCATGVNPMPA